MDHCSAALNLDSLSADQIRDFGSAFRLNPHSQIKGLGADIDQGKNCGVILPRGPPEGKDPFIQRQHLLAAVRVERGLLFPNRQEMQHALKNPRVEVFGMLE